MELPSEMTPGIREVIGTPCFKCIRFAEIFRELGYPIEHTAEGEQAAYIWFALPFAIKHGSDWHEHANEELKRLQATRKELIEQVQSTPLAAK